MTQISRQEIIPLKNRIEKNFKEVNWREIAIITDTSDIIINHSRLLRSLGWGDSDYPDCIFDVLEQIYSRSPILLSAIKQYINENFENEGEFISSKPSPRVITFAPEVFKIPDKNINTNQVAIMMPFQGMSSVYDAICTACKQVNFLPKRADEIWNHATIIDDIFELIFCSSIVIADFTGKNSNVMYEIGIAHTLGKIVIPITQSLNDLPFDFRHHRALTYLHNNEGLAKLTNDLANKLKNEIPF